MSRWIAISFNNPPAEDIIGLRWTLLNFVGCVSPLDASYASPFARKSAETGQIS
jgi:hypothetical protein